MIHITYKKNLRLKALIPQWSCLSLFFIFFLQATSSFASDNQTINNQVESLQRTDHQPVYKQAVANKSISNDPARIIKTTLKKIITFSNYSKKMAFTGSTSNNQATQLRDFIEHQIIPNFDFDNMSHWITGRYASNMSEQDKTDFKRNLRETFLSSLSKHLGSFDAKNTRIKFHRARYRGKQEAFVSASIYRPNSIAVRLDFRMRRADDTWKIIDIKANGASAVLYYRRHFISQLRQYQSQYQNPYQHRY